MKRIYRQINHYLDYCVRTRNMTETTMRGKKSVYTRFAKFLTDNHCNRLEDLTNPIFNEWMGRLLEQGVTPRTINTYNASVLAMIRYYREIGVEIPLKIPLIRKLKEGKIRKQFYTRAQIREVIRQADATTGLMVRICFDTGMRIAELTNLKIDNFSGRRVDFISKGRKPREAYITPKTEQKLMTYLKKNKITSNLWISKSGKPLTVAGVRKRLQKVFRAAGYDDFYPHALRHSFATDLELRGATVSEIQQMIGHTNIATTERYLHALDGHLAELFRKYR